MSKADELRKRLERMNPDALRPAERWCNDAIAALVAAEGRLYRLAAMGVQLPDGYTVGDDATVELAVKCVELEKEIDRLRAAARPDRGDSRYWP